jgi:hypothetical protein
LIALGAYLTALPRPKPVTPVYGTGSMVSQQSNDK